MGGPATRDLVVLVPDNKIEAVVRAICLRGKSFGFMEPAFTVRRHPGHDAGCFRNGHLALQPLANQFAHAIVIFDKEGCGKERLTREDLEAEVEGRLSVSGRRDRAKAIVIDPELEAWVWSDSPQVAQALGWRSDNKALRNWLVEQGWSQPGQVKPRRPKETYEATLRRAGIPQSIAIYRQLAETVSVARCTDPAFLKLKTVLQEWFKTP